MGVDPLAVAKRECLQGNLDRALAVLEAADQRRPPSALRRDLRGWIYLEQKKFEEATRAFQAAQEADPALFLPRLHLGDVLLRQGKWAEARAHYETLIKETKILMANERLRFAIFMTYLGAKDDAQAQEALQRITFPTETAAYYYAQAAWAYSRGSKRAGAKWIRTAEDIFDATKTAWFARPLYELGWIKTKPPLVSY